MELFAKLDPPDGIVYGEECCADSSVSFHYISADLMQQIDNYIYLCSENHKRDFYDIHGNQFCNESTRQKLMDKNTN